jgi:molybdopterin-binding protein
MPLSARNKLKGVIKAIEKGEVAATVKIEITGPATITPQKRHDGFKEEGVRSGQRWRGFMS